MSRSKNAGSRLGTQQRGALLDAYDQRGHSQSELFYFFSPKARADIALPSRIQFGLALSLESDPRVKTINYTPPYRRATLEGGSTIFDAEVTCWDGTTELHEAKTASDVAKDPRSRRQLAIQQAVEEYEQRKGSSCTHILSTEDELFSNPIRTLNWVEVLPWIAQARHLSLVQATKEVVTFLSDNEYMTLRQLLQAGGPVHAAAAFQAVGNGALGSDLWDVAFSMNTTLKSLRSSSLRFEPRQPKRASPASTTVTTGDSS